MTGAATNDAMKCPSLEEVLESVEAGRHSAALAAHLRDRCPRCAESVERAEAILGLLSAARLEEVPDRLRARALSIPTSERAEKRAKVGGWARLVARLVPPTRGDLMPAFRGGGEGKHLLFRAEDHAIDVALLPNGSLVGQVLPESEGAHDFTEGYGVLSGEQRTVTCDINEEGEFLFASVSAGRYGLLLRSGDQSLVVDEIDLGREPGG